MYFNRLHCYPDHRVTITILFAEELWLQMDLLCWSLPLRIVLGNNYIFNKIFKITLMMYFKIDINDVSSTIKLNVNQCRFKKK